jgi:enamine deaminase RidA (YjgF/YER057c/UK114 family)
VDGVVTGVGDAHAQALTALEIALTALCSVGAAVTDVVRTRIYVTDRANADAVGRAHGEIFGAVRPVATMIIVAGLLHPDMLVEFDLEAHAPARS